MGTGKKNKIEHEFSPAEAADYLRQLAQALEEGHISLDQRDMLLEGEVKVRPLKTRLARGWCTCALSLIFTCTRPWAGPCPWSRRARQSQ